MASGYRSGQQFSQFVPVAYDVEPKEAYVPQS